jgi:hypothetical protein
MGRLTSAMSCVLVLLALCLAGAPVAQAPHWSKPKDPQRVRLYPKFQTGQTLYYQMDFRSRTSGTSEGLIVSPEASKEQEVSISALLRLDVISVAPGPSPEARPSVHLRTTYQKVASTIRTDVPDPQADQLHDRIEQLENKSLEFTIGAGGQVSGIRGLEDIFPEQQPRLREWLTGIGFTASLPAEGIYPGMKWSSAPPENSGLPLAGIAWESESTYLRDEPCHVVKLIPEETGVQVPNPESCAVILSAMSLDGTAKHSDRTPPEFRAKNLRTHGTMSGNGQSLTYISLETGLVVSVTQTSRQDMDVTVSSDKGGSSLRYQGNVETQWELSLLPVPSGLPSNPPK